MIKISGQKISAIFTKYFSQVKASMSMMILARFTFHDRMSLKRLSTFKKRFRWILLVRYVLMRGIYIMFGHIFTKTFHLTFCQPNGFYDVNFTAPNGKLNAKCFLVLYLVPLFSAYVGVLGNYFHYDPGACFVVEIASTNMNRYVNLYKGRTSPLAVQLVKRAFRLLYAAVN